MKTGIVILNYNDYKTTKQFLETIKSYKAIDYILVVDNNSTDNSYEELSKIKIKNYEIIKTKKNKGYAYGNNYGVKYLYDKYNIDYVIISNPDVLFTNDTIKKLKEDISIKKMSLIAPTIVEHGKISRGWKLPTFKDDLLSNIIYFQKYFKNSLNYNESYYLGKELAEVEAVHGCFFMINVKDFKKVGFFDEKTFLYYEENILGKKLKNKNLKVYVDTNLKVIHNLSVSVDKTYNLINKYKLLKDSQKYYEVKYNKINCLQLFILRLFYYVSLLLANIKVFILSRRKK